MPKPRPTPAFRLLTVFLSKRFSGWKEALVIVKTETVIRWHRRGFKLYWMFKSREKPGRPKVSRQTIALIKRIHKENPLLSPEKIHELLVNLAVSDAPAANTIAKYLPDTRKPRSEKQSQSWKTFLRNQNLWSMDFLTVPTIRFQVLYVLVIISHARRRIEHFAVTTNPIAKWTVQQLREATPYGKQPQYILHDNYSIFTGYDLQRFLSNANIESVRTSYRSPWQNGICERLIGIIRQEVLNHIIPFSQRHLERILREYVNGYYNPHRTHQGIGCETPDASPRLAETKASDVKLVSKELLGGLYHTYTRTA
jgi:transposase InsO family protein